MTNQSRLFLGLILGGLLMLSGCESSDSASRSVYLGQLWSETTGFKAEIGHILGQDASWEAGFPQKFIETTLKNGKIPYIRWQPWIWEDPESIPVGDVLSGEWDHYIDDWAQKTQKREYPIFFELIQNPLDTHHQVIHYVSKRFLEKGAYNVRWVVSQEQFESLEVNSDMKIWCAVHDRTDGSDAADLPIFFFPKASFFGDEASMTVFLNENRSIKAVWVPNSAISEANLQNPIFDANIDDI